MNSQLYSLRMRAERAGRHISGAERIVPAEQVSAASAELISRAMGASQDSPADIHCRVEPIDPLSVRYAALPDVRTWPVPDWQTGRQMAADLLVKAGVVAKVAVEALRLLAEGPAPGGEVMRGALILDAETGRRLDADPQRGVRVSRMDLAPEVAADIKAQLAVVGLTHHRVCEALVLAGKVQGAPGLVAELCWSDAPDYLAGYVSDPAQGYQRISQLKPAGDRRGGRVFFVQTTDWKLDRFTNYLEQQVVLFNALGTICSSEQGM